jgi:hypothetical protein
VNNKECTIRDEKSIMQMSENDMVEVYNERLGDHRHTFVMGNMQPLHRIEAITNI